MHWWLPPRASTFAGAIDGLFIAILIVTGIAFVLVETGLVWFVVRYRQRPGRRATYTRPPAPKSAAGWARRVGPIPTSSSPPNSGNASPTSVTRLGRRRISKR